MFRLLLALVLAAPAAAQPGALVALGGGARPAAVLDTFVALAGRAGARVVVVPYASAAPDSAGARLAAELRRAGAGRVAVALGPPDAAATLALLDDATGVFLAGGDQNRLVAALAGTRFLGRLRARHAAGAVVGGTSAGAAVLSAVMITGETRDGTAENPWGAVRAGRVATAEGLGLIAWGVVDQHFLARSRHNRLLSLVLEAPALLGVGVDEATAVVVAADGTFGVVGEGAVAVYDARAALGIAPDADGDFAAEGVRLHLLTHGQRFDPAAGRVLR